MVKRSSNMCYFQAESSLIWDLIGIDRNRCLFLSLGVIQTVNQPSWRILKLAHKIGMIIITLDLRLIINQTLNCKSNTSVTNTWRTWTFIPVTRLCTSQLCDTKREQTWVYLWSPKHLKVRLEGKHQTVFSSDGETEGFTKTNVLKWLRFELFKSTATSAG